MSEQLLREILVELRAIRSAIGQKSTSGGVYVAMSKQTDRQLIATLGGPTKVAELLSLPKYGGVQRVQNWTQRGIPSHVKVEFPHLFMPELAANTQQAPAVSA